ncbi:uncharacterized protein JN550_003782 [Neoarthrinium moseri]|uniref:uncharacterized protein n=1 Tax=Neoarthrinium moseri TaxID=1658444 RepID=UPI001FDCE41A|nr:uncharacterized protein JN550_003782 [Neoarthrinium moseri]KAI1872908.1 hypothetical protein JN550_003782 [Neoarthrinium moseri]
MSEVDTTACHKRLLSPPPDHNTLGMSELPPEDWRDAGLKNSLVCSDTTQLPPPTPPGPGILTVTRSWARDLIVDNPSEPICLDKPHAGRRRLIHSIMECGKAQVSSEATCYSRMKRKTKILTGIPPFYQENVEEQQRRIMEHTLQLPKGLPATAKDILIKLLNKDPAKRLGATGASEIKGHGFFHEIDWNDITQRRRENLPMAKQDGVVFRVEPDEVKYSKSYHETGTDEDERNAPDGKPEEVQDDRWELVWEPTSQRSHFHNRLTSEKRSIDTYPLIAYTLLMDNKDTAVGDYRNLGAQNHRASLNQKKCALKAALEGDCSNLLVSQVLEYGLNLDVAFLQHVEEYTGASYGLPIALVKWLIPLEWVLDSGNTQLVELFLGKGADANFSTFPRDGPALVKAVKKMDQKLIRMLLPTTNRVNSTRALCHAVELQDIGIATTLIRTAFFPTLKI